MKYVKIHSDFQGQYQSYLTSNAKIHISFLRFRKRLRHVMKIQQKDSGFADVTEHTYEEFFFNCMLIMSKNCIMIP